MQTRPEGHLTHGPRDQDRLILVVAVFLTVTMFGWQGYHLYAADKTASRKQTTTLVEGVHSAGEHQIDLIETLEHQVLALGLDLTRPDVAEWPDQYAAASSKVQAATEAALAGDGERIEGPVRLIDATRRELDHQVDRVVEVLSTGDNEQATAALLDPQYLAAQAEFGSAVDGQIGALAADLRAQSDAERLDEFRSVAVALALFAMAIGAWAIFLQHLRRHRGRLAKEQQRRLEAETESSQLQKLEALGMMADGVAHDVKNLTAVILGSAGEVRQSLPEAHPAAAGVTRIERATRQADDMAQSLLAFSRKTASPRGAVNLASLAVDMKQLLRYMVPPQIELTVDTPAEAWVCGHTVQLQQVVFNLTTNACHAMPGGGRLTITVRAASPDDGEDSAWLLEIRDSGQGMTPEVVERLFEPFFTTRPSAEGSGLGLAIVHRIVTDHRGSIEVSTRPDEGSTFTIRLPALPGPPAAPDRREERGSVVLVAHPAPYVRNLISGVLAAEGHHTLTASTVDEIGACFVHEQPTVDVLVLDSQLLLSNRLAVPPDVSVIATGDWPPTARLGEHPDVRVVGGPLSLAALTEAVADVIGSADSLVRS